MRIRTLGYWLSGSALALGLLAGSVGAASAQRMGFHGASGGGFHGGIRGGFHTGPSFHGGGSFRTYRPGGFYGGHFGFGYRRPFHRFYYGPSFFLSFGAYPFFYSDYPYYYPYYDPYDYTYPYYDGDPYYTPPPAPQSSYRVGEKTPTTPPQDEANAEDQNDYYLNSHPERSAEVQQEPGLSQAITDIQLAFRSGDISLLERHVEATENLTILSRGHAPRTMKGSDYLDKTSDALPKMQTERFDLTHAQRMDDDTWSVSGTHAVRGANGKVQEFHIRFTLKKRDAGWYITQVSADRM